jgi:hypothetical protein
MGSFIFDNRDSLSAYHYVRKAAAEDYWFDIRFGKLREYIAQFGEGFCIVLYASEQFDNCYILPFGFVKDLFKDEFLYNGTRWMGSISGDLLRVRNSGTTLSVSGCYNAFELLGEDQPQTPKTMGESQNLYQVENDIELSHLEAHIAKFNEIYQNATPQKRITISNQIARPNAITDYLKQIQNYICQICGELGFMQSNGKRYIETHHIIELHRSIPGSYCSDNIIVVCANCHRKLHYAPVDYVFVDERQIVLKINDVQYQFTRNVISPVE